MDTFERWPTCPSNTRCKEEDFVEYVGDAFWAVLKFIEIKTSDLESRVVVEHTKSGKFNIFFEFYKTTNPLMNNKSHFWFRVAEAKPEVSLEGLDTIHQKLNIPQSCSLHNPGFFKWLSQACAMVKFMVDYLDDEMEKAYVNNPSNSNRRLRSGSDLSPPGMDVLEVVLDSRRQSEEDGQEDRSKLRQSLH
jgi:hypothetical protein